MLTSIMEKNTIFWFRRDLRLQDNAGLYHALKESPSVLPLFIFDYDILSQLSNPEDLRVQFIYNRVLELKQELQGRGSDLILRYGKPLEVLQQLSQEKGIKAIYLNHDDESSAIHRDAAVEKWTRSQNISFKHYKDHSLFERNEILTGTGKPYTVFTPYKNKVLESLEPFYLKSYPTEKYMKSLAKVVSPEAPLSLFDIGFAPTDFDYPSSEVPVDVIKKYAQQRDYPAIENGTSHVGLHLRFGTVSIREVARLGKKYSEVWLSELIWRDFFKQILWHYPHVERQSFRPQYDKIAWRDSQADFKRWCEGQTGYAMVDAGMRELNATGTMHNRVRMITASFLCKHLLIHWSWGERYFAEKLLDFDLSANNGNWQWVAGSGCDAAPYFRIFNPETQADKFDPQGLYRKKWVPEWQTGLYVKSMIEHTEARQRCLKAFTDALKGPL